MMNPVLKYQPPAAKLDGRPVPQWLDSEHAASQIAGAHPFLLQIGLSGAAWFLAVAWLDFSYGLAMHLAPVMLTGILVMSLTLLLLTLSGRLQQEELDHRSGCARRHT